MLLLTLLSLAGQLTAALRRPGGLTPPQPKVAAVVPVHPPKFAVFQDFLHEWAHCDEGLRVMDVMPVFSNGVHREGFQHQYCKGQPPEECRASLPYRPLLMDDYHTDKKNLKSWKKLDGVAQVLDSDWDGRYEFLLMLDCELQLGSCAGFSELLPRLRAKHKAKLWYAHWAVAAHHMRKAACTLSILSGAVDRVVLSPSRVPCRGDLEVMSIARKETKNFTIYTWWNDLPYLHADTARRMFTSWARMLDASAPSPSYTFVTRTMLPSPTDVAKMMGEGPEELTVAASAFEHLMYSMYTVVHEGFHFLDMTGRFNFRVRWSLGEGFCRMTEKDKTTYMQTVEPLWQVAGCELFDNATKPLLLRFHVDRYLKELTRDQVHSLSHA